MANQWVSDSKNRIPGGGCQISSPNELGYVSVKSRRNRVDIMDSETETEGNNVERRAKVGFKVAEGEEPSPESKRRRAAQATSEAAGTTASRKRTVVELDAEDEKRRGDDPAAEKEERARTPKDKAKEKATEPGIRIVKKDDKVVVEAFEFAGEPEIIDETTGKAGKKKKSVRKVKVANGETVMIADTDEEEAAKPYKKKDKSKRVKVVNGQTSMLSDGDDEREVIDERTGKPIGKKKKRLKKVKVVGGQTVTTTDTDGEVEVVNGKKKGRKSAKESTSDSKLEDRLQELEDARDSDMIAARKARREERLRQRLDPESDQDTTPMKRSARKRRDLAAQQDYDDDDSGGQNQSSSRLSRSRNAPTRDDPNAPDYYRAPQQQVQAQAPPIPAAATQYQPVPMPMAMPASAPSQPAYIPSAPAAAPSAPAAAAAPVPVIVQQGGGPVPMQMPTQMYTTPNNGSGQNIPVGQQAGPSRPPEEPTVPISSMSNQKPKAKSVVVETESEAEAEEKSAFKGKGHKLGKKPDDKPPEAPPLEVKREATPTAPEVESPPLTPLSSLPSAPIDGARPEQLELEPVTDSDDDLETRLRQNDPKKYEQFMAAEAERRREVPRVVEGGLKEGLSDSVGPDNTFSTLQNKRATNEQMTMAQEEDPTDYRTGGNNKAWDEEYRRGESAPTGRITNTQFDKGEGVIPDDTAISESSRDTERATKDTPLTTSLDAPDLRTAKSDPLPVPMDQESIESSQQQWKDSRPLGNIKPEQNRIDKMDLTLKDRPQEAWRDSGPQKKGKEKDDGQRNSRIGIPIAEKLSDEAWREERPSPTKLSGGKPSLSDSSTAAWEDEQSSGSRIDQKATVGFKSDAINDTDQRSDRAWREVKPSPIETSHEIPELAESPGREWRKKRPLSAERDTFTGVEGRKTVNQGGMMLASSIDRSKVEAGETPGGSRGSKSSPPEGKIMDQPASDLGGSLDSKHQKEKPLRTDENEVAEQQAVLQTGSQKAEASGRTAPPSAVSASKHEEGHMPSDMAWLEERPSPLRPSHEAPELPESPGREWRNERPSPVKSEASMPIETDPVAFGRPGMMLPSAVDRSKIEAYQPPLDSPSWSEEAGQRLGGKGKEKNHDPFPELMNIESTGRETSPLSGKQAKNDDQPSFNATPSGGYA
ncbi:hypothetical protein BD324DRAFT_305084 [Kockovaella imperatae]|uniref:Uncharacterized protein n=1 Tax=Kockovaella imperatae TaxID=4999 RepID=A0A1Y1UM02_9TREE|nr:hypothetical protein BD324DRAFT_305084 [Kockovaella imperatae]ORX39029.1 hypothetical protein BD324DRAFT_305084 [Kockovaella imperatae]